MQNRADLCLVFKENNKCNWIKCEPISKSISVLVHAPCARATKQYIYLVYHNFQRKIEKGLHENQLQQQPAATSTL